MTQPSALSPAAGALAGKRLMVATPMYEGMCHALYTRGLVELGLKCREAGVSLRLNLITNQASIAHARAYIAGAFLQSDCDHLMMIDADMGFAAADVMTLLSLQTTGKHEVIGAAGAHKRIDWERIGNAARADRALPLARDRCQRIVIGHRYLPPGLPPCGYSPGQFSAGRHGCLPRRPARPVARISRRRRPCPPARPGRLQPW